MATPILRRKYAAKKVDWSSFARRAEHITTKNMTEVTDSRKPTKKSSKPSSVVLENENQAVQGHTDDASFHPWPGQQV